jgi:hypothetical protein
MQRTLALVTIAAASTAATAEANFWRWTYGTAPNNSVVAEFDPVTKRFKWEFGAGTNVNGFWTSVSPGPQPRGDAGEFAALFLDASALTANSTITPKLTAYAYNGVPGSDNNSFTTSWWDGSPAAGTQAPDRIWSSLNPATAGIIMQLSATDYGTYRRFTVEIDASVIQNHTPLYPDANGEPWTGVAFGSLIGHWFHPVIGLNATYGTDPNSANYNWLTSFNFTGWTFSDMTNRPTEWVIPSPGAFALLGLAGIAGARRRR